MIHKIHEMCNISEQEPRTDALEQPACHVRNTARTGSGTSHQYWCR